jgi:chitinase
LSNATANARRNAVLARLEAKNPGLRVSYTLPVDPNGIPESGRRLLANAREGGAQVYSVNVMTMDFGPAFSKGKKMSDVSVASAMKAYEQCRQIDPGVRLGLTPMIGQNDQAGEIFTTEDARALLSWAQEQPWVCSLSFWSSNRDAGGRARRGNGNTTSGIGQKPWAFTTVFQAFTTHDRQ